MGGGFVVCLVGRRSPLAPVPLTLALSHGGRGNLCKTSPLMPKGELKGVWTLIGHPLRTALRWFASPYASRRGRIGRFCKGFGERGLLLVV